MGNVYPRSRCVDKEMLIVDGMCKNAGKEKDVFAKIVG